MEQVVVYLRISEDRTGAEGGVERQRQDRPCHRPRELEDLIDLVETHPVRIETVKGSAFDLNPHEGRLMTRQLVAIASYESGHETDRIRRANRQKAERGDWRGGAKYGYGIGSGLIPEEAAVIRERADRFLAGQSVRQICTGGLAGRLPYGPGAGSMRQGLTSA